MSVGTLSPRLAGIPIVRNADERDGLFPVPGLYQRVHNLQSATIQMWNGAAWIDVFFAGALATGTPQVTVDDVVVLAQPQVINFTGRVSGAPDGTIADIDIPDLPVKNGSGTVVVASPGGLRFTGSGVAISTVGGDALLTITAGGGVTAKDDGVDVVTGATGLDFTGPGVTVTDQGGGVAEIAIPGAETFQLAPTGLWLNLRADAGLVGLANGDPVDTWEDQSASGFDFTAAGAARPTYRDDASDGLPYLLFDGSNNYFKYTVGSPYTGYDFTIMWVVRWYQQAGSRGLSAVVSTGETSGGGNSSFHLYEAAARLVGGGGSNRSIGTQTNEQATWQWCVYGLRFQQTASPMPATHFKTLLQGANMGTLEFSPSAQINTDFLTLGGVDFDGDGNVDGLLRCDVRHMVAWNRALDDAEMRSAVGYLRETWKVFS